MSKLTPIDRVIKAKIDLNTERPFYSYVLMQMSIEQTKSSKTVPTMGVDKWGNIYWNEGFVASLSDANLKAVLAHEALHVCTLTFSREGNKDHLLWNIATDLIINTYLKADGFELPQDFVMHGKNDNNGKPLKCIMPDEDGSWTFTGKGNKKYTIDNVIEKTAEDIYDFISSHAEVVKAKMGGCNGASNGSFDKHIEDDTDDKANQEKWKKIGVEASTVAKQRGKGSSVYDRIIDKLVDPEVDWRVRLSQFITKDLPVDFTMSRPGRRFYSSGIYYPSIIRESLNVIVGIDVSGSISDAEYSKFISEVVGISSAFDQIKMRVIWWSTKVIDGDDIEVTRMNSHETISHAFRSTDGTEMSCFAEYCQQNNIQSNVYVIFTDGCIEEKPVVPNGQILFVTAGSSASGDIIKNYGEVCRLKLEK